jgi:hypothetical protein
VVVIDYNALLHPERRLAEIGRLYKVLRRPMAQDEAERVLASFGDPGMSHSKGEGAALPRRVERLYREMSQHHARHDGRDL